jgi:N-acetylglucosamine kinase-like BadF-type ATPase
MILLADSGATKTSWLFTDGKGNSKKVNTSGINPFFRNTEDIYTELKNELSGFPQTNIEQLFFYGAGIVNNEKRDVIQPALSLLFPNAKIEIESDLLAAARATLANQEGIACILGTGSNSCFYDGVKITRHVPPLGFILGDEGSGAFLGKRLLADYLKGIMPEKLSKKFQKEFPVDYSMFLEKTYREEKPNHFLAQFAPFLHQNVSEKYCSELVKDSFRQFIERNVARYKNYRQYPVCFTGSVAYHFQQQLNKVLTENQIQPGRILQEPLEGLLKYHLQ